MSQRFLAVLVGVMVVFGAGGWGRTEDAGGPGQREAAAAVRGFGDEHRTVPAGFGYQPETLRLASGDAVSGAPNGGCSSPIGGSPYGFTDACRQHDLGYDLLRYADRRGEPLGPWARQAIDDEFARQLTAGCGGLADVGCRLMAATYIGTVRFNSWRQGYGVPRNETLAQLLGPVVAGAGAGAGLWLLMRAPRRSLRPERIRPVVLAGAR